MGRRKSPREIKISEKLLPSYRLYRRIVDNSELVGEKTDVDEIVNYVEGKNPGDSFSASDRARLANYIRQMMKFRDDFKSKVEAVGVDLSSRDLFMNSLISLSNDVFDNLCNDIAGVYNTFANLNTAVYAQGGPGYAGITIFEDFVSDRERAKELDEERGTVASLTIEKNALTDDKKTLTAEKDFESRLNYISNMKKEKDKEAAVQMLESDMNSTPELLNAGKNHYSLGSGATAKQVADKVREEFGLKIGTGLRATLKHIGKKVVKPKSIIIGALGAALTFTAGAGTWNGILHHTKKIENENQISIAQRNNETIMSNWTNVENLAQQDGTAPVESYVVELSRGLGADAQSVAQQKQLNKASEGEYKLEFVTNDDLTNILGAINTVVTTHFTTDLEKAYSPEAELYNKYIGFSTQVSEYKNAGYKEKADSLDALLTAYGVESIDALKALIDSDPEFRNSVIEALGLDASATDAEILEAVGNAVKSQNDLESLLADYGVESIDALKALIGAGDEGFRASVIEALGLDANATNEEILAAIAEGAAAKADLENLLSTYEVGSVDELVNLINEKDEYSKSLIASLNEFLDDEHKLSDNATPEEVTAVIESIKEASAAKALEELYADLGVENKEELIELINKNPDQALLDEIATAFGLPAGSSKDEIISAFNNISNAYEALNNQVGGMLEALGVESLEELQNRYQENAEYRQAVNEALGLDANATAEDVQAAVDAKVEEAVAAAEVAARAAAEQEFLNTFNVNSMEELQNKLANDAEFRAQVVESFDGTLGENPTNEQIIDALTELKNENSDLKSRVAALEEMCNQYGIDLAAAESDVAKLQEAIVQLEEKLQNSELFQQALADMLGLPADATEEQIRDAIVELFYAAGYIDSEEGKDSYTVPKGRNQNSYSTQIDVDTYTLTF